MASLAICINDLAKVKVMLTAATESGVPTVILLDRVAETAGRENGWISG